MHLVKQSLIFLFLLFTLAGIAFSDESVNVPIGHWSYDYVEKLAVMGIVDSFGLSMRPISRVQMAERVGEVIDKIQIDVLDFGLESERIKVIEDMVYRLTDEYRHELVEMGFRGISDTDALPPINMFKVGSPFSIETIYLRSKVSAPLLFENHEGWELRAGGNVNMNIDSWLRMRDTAAFSLSPLLRYSRDNAELNLKNAYLKFSLFDSLEIELGRDSIWWGPGYHGALLVSNNAFPLDSLKLQNREPFRLPWAFENLGRFNAMYFISQLETKRDHERPFLTGTRLEYSPIDNLEFDFSHTVLFGGSGAKDISVYEFLSLYDLSKGGGENEEPDHIASAGFKLTLPLFEMNLPMASGLQVYGELGVEDDSIFSLTQTGILGGFYIADALGLPGLDLRFERAETEKGWYEHSFYKSGYTYRGFILGHHMAGDSDDTYFRISKRFEENNLEFSVAIDVEHNGNTKPYIQTKNEGQLDISFFPNENTLVRFGYELNSFTNFGNVANNSVREHVVKLGLQADF